MSRIISYRGLLASDGQDTINLHTNDGKTGYKIVKFQLFPKAPGQGATADIEATVKIYTMSQSVIDGLVDFNDNTLLAAGYLVDSNSVANTTQLISVFDNMKVNQDIYVTNKESNSIAVNYYIELEQIDLTEDQALVAIVKNLRNEQ